MKTRKPKTTKPPHPAEAASSAIGFSPEQGETLRRCASKCGQSMEDFARGIIINGLERLDSIEPLDLPCPYCDKTDELEIISWSQEKRDGTDFDSLAVRCHRCESVVTLPAWMMRGLRFENGTAARKGGDA